MIDMNNVNGSDLVTLAGAFTTLGVAIKTLWAKIKEKDDQITALNAKVLETLEKNTVAFINLNNTIHELTSSLESKNLVERKKNE